MDDARTISGSSGCWNATLSPRDPCDLGSLSIVEGLHKSGGATFDRNAALNQFAVVFGDLFTGLRELS